MPQYALKQSQTARPLLFLMIDSTDHISGKTGLSPTVTISKNGAAFASPAGAVTELSNGWYQVAGNATDTGTLGALLLHATGSGADPCDAVFEVVAYDPDDAVSLGLSAVNANTIQISGDATAADNAEAFFDNTGFNASNSEIGAVASVTAIATGGITAASIATNAIDADALAADAVAEIADGVWDEARAGHVGAGSFGEGVASVQGDVTGDVQGNVDGSVGSVATGGITVASFAAGAIDAAAIATDAIGAAELAASAVDKIVDQVWDELRAGHVVAGSFGQALQLIHDGTAQAGAAGTITLDTGASAIDDFYVNAIVFAVGGTGVGQARFISDYVGSTRVASITPNWVTTPDATTVFVILPFGEVPGATAPTAIENADALLDRDMSTGTDSGTDTVRTVRQALRFLRNRWNVSSGGALDVYKEDDATISWSGVVQTDAAAVPIVGNNPAGGS